MLLFSEEEQTVQPENSARTEECIASFDNREFSL